MRDHNSLLMTAGLGRLSAVDLFCGAGGLSYGMRRAGIPVHAGIDIDPHCRYPFETNNKARFVECDVASMDASDLTKLFEPASIRILVGCAPCQPFSSYSHGRVVTSDHRWALLDSFCDLILAGNPHIVSMENVIELEHQAIYRRFVRRLTRAGYQVSAFRVRCNMIGVPQNRKRLVVFASIWGKVSLLEQVKRVVTVRDAIGKLPKIAAGETCASDPLHRAATLSDLNLKRIRSSRPGGFWREWSPELWAKCHRRRGGKTFRSVYSRMSWDEPSPTITTQAFKFGTGRYGHPEQDRAISLREAALLQTFPRRYRFVRPGDPISFATLGRLIGNAVPVKLGEVIAKSILAHIRAQRHITESTDG